MSRHKISAINIAFLYVGTLMGAGFASGREIWQFFGVFGEKSYFAVLAVTILFVLFGMMTVKISETMDTTDIGKIIMPFENKYLENFSGYIIAVILFIAYVVMAAAGGALFQEQFGLPRIFGGIILMLMVIATILGGFERISKNFKYIIPVLLIIVFLVCFYIMFRQLPASGIQAEMKVSPMTPSWYSSAVIYISYNMLSGIPIMASSAHRAKTYKAALTGAALGGLILGFAALTMNLAMLTDAGLSSASVLPILALSGKLSGWARWVYAVLLLFAVYSSATSNFYGFTTKIKEGRNKKTFIIIASVIGFLLSLFGFADIIAFVLPLEGYCGLVFLAAMTIHYMRIMTAGKGSGNNERFQFAGGIKRVTAGHGGEAQLIIGSEKTALIDCGMAYCGEALVENIKKELGERPLDYVILTHTHYDHVGGLPYLRRAWPDLISFGAVYGKKILEKDSALKQIEILSRSEWKNYSETKMEPAVLMDGLKVDRTICEKDIISMGDKELHVFETPGHTTCSLTFLLEPDKILFPSETTGVYAGSGLIITGMLKSCRETIASIEKCRKIDADYIIAPHYGQVPQYDKEAYWDLALASVNRNKEFILRKIKEGALFDEIMEEYTKEFYIDFVSNEQPKEAFLLNAQHMIHNLIKEFRVI
jgi:uncharacterized membrane protein YkvI/glyoxylase-like metal-dependent hydrolase (beta-lactamase superfamily II)